MGKGGAGRNQGRKVKGGEEFRRVQFATRLPRWLITWLRLQPDNATTLIEEALIQHNQITPPSD